MYSVEEGGGGRKKRTALVSIEFSFNIMETKKRVVMLWKGGDVS